MGLSLDFRILPVHRYMLGNYRRVYAQTLAAGINHFNQAMIIRNLLATGAETADEHRDSAPQDVGPSLLGFCGPAVAGSGVASTLE